MTRKTWTEFQTTLADNTTNAISPSDVRDIPDTFSTMYGVCTWTPGGTVSTTGGTWVQAPVAVFGSALTNGVSVSGGVISFRDVGRYMVLYRLGGTLTMGTIKARLRYKIAGAPDTELPYTTIANTTDGTDAFGMSGNYLMYVPTTDTRIELQYQTTAGETWTAPEAFVTIISIPTKYEGA
jgi:hypothetical protein